MRRAIELALDNVRAGVGGPFGAVVVYEGSIIAEGVNRVTTDNDPTAHAEVIAVRRAASTLRRFRLSGCSIYSSCEPCPMCLGAIYWARLDRIYYSAGRLDAASAGFDDSLIYGELAIAPPHRRIPAEQLLPAEADLPFQAWRDSPERIPY